MDRAKCPNAEEEMITILVCLYLGYMSWRYGTRITFFTAPGAIVVMFVAALIADALLIATGP